MSTPNADEIQMAIDELREPMEMMGLYLGVEDGLDGYAELAVEESPITMTFPGDNETQAMGHALKIQEHFENGGLSVEREYHGVVETFDHPDDRDLHAITFHISTEDEPTGPEGGA